MPPKRSGGSQTTWSVRDGPAWSESVLRIAQLLLCHPVGLHYSDEPHASAEPTRVLGAREFEGMSKIRSHVNRCGFSRRPVSTFDREPDRAVVRGLEQRRDCRRRQGGDIAQILQEQMRRLGEERNRGQPTSLVRSHDVQVCFFHTQGERSSLQRHV